jgi:hypothetical protein
MITAAPIQQPPKSAPSAPKRSSEVSAMAAMR